LHRLRSEGVSVSGGGMLRDDGIVLIDEEDVSDAFEVLTRLGIRARIG
jgi:hypothetical protein